MLITESQICEASKEIIKLKPEIDCKETISSKMGETQNSEIGPQLD